MMDIERILTPNPLQSYCILGLVDKTELHQLMYAENLEWGYNHEEALKWANHQHESFFDALTTKEEHCGDCTSIACSCIKCQAEDVVGQPNNLLLANWHLIRSAFNGTEDILKAIEELAKPVVFTYEVSPTTVQLWNRKQQLTRSSLIEYYINWCSQ